MNHQPRGCPALNQLLIHEGTHYPINKHQPINASWRPLCLLAPSTTTHQRTLGHPQHCLHLPTPAQTQRPRITVPLPFHMTPRHRGGFLPRGNKVGEETSLWSCSGS